MCTLSKVISIVLVLNTFVLESLPSRILFSLLDQDKRTGNKSLTLQEHAVEEALRHNRCDALIAWWVSVLSSYAQRDDQPCRRYEELKKQVLKDKQYIRTVCGVTYTCVTSNPPKSYISTPCSDTLEESCEDMREQALSDIQLYANKVYARPGLSKQEKNDYATTVSAMTTRVMKLYESCTQCVHGHSVRDTQCAELARVMAEHPALYEKCFKNV